MASLLTGVLPLPGTLWQSSYTRRVNITVGGGNDNNVYKYRSEYDRAQKQASHQKEVPEYIGYIDKEFSDRREGLVVEHLNIEGGLTNKPIMHVQASPQGCYFWTFIERIPYKEGLKLDMHVIHGLGNDFTLKKGKFSVSCGIYHARDATKEFIENLLQPVVTDIEFPVKEYTQGQTIYTKEYLTSFNVPPPLFPLDGQSQAYVAVKVEFQVGGPDSGPDEQIKDWYFEGVSLLEGPGGPNKGPIIRPPDQPKCCSIF